MDSKKDLREALAEFEARFSRDGSVSHDEERGYRRSFRWGVADFMRAFECPDDPPIEVWDDVLFVARAEALQTRLAAGQNAWRDDYCVVITRAEGRYHGIGIALSAMIDLDSMDQFAGIAHRWLAALPAWVEGDCASRVRPPLPDVAGSY